MKMGAHGPSAPPEIRDARPVMLCDRCGGAPPIFVVAYKRCAVRGSSVWRLRVGAAGKEPWYRINPASPSADRARVYGAILNGAKPGDLSIETAKALGLTIPPSLLLRADQVIE